MSKLITASFSKADADIHTAYVPSDADKAVLASVGSEILKHFPPVPGACMVMSSLYSVMLERHLKNKAYVVVGSLYVGDTRVFGSDDEFDGKSRFSKSDPSWDGHAWIVLGDHVADVSLFRTARSGKSHPALASHVATEFGPKAGLMICKERHVERSRLRYEARYVLTQDQVDGLARGAQQIIQNKQR